MPPAAAASFSRRVELEDLFGPGAPVQDVAELDEMGLAARPVEVVVDEADLRVGEDEDEAVVVAVEVGDGPRPGRRPSIRRGCRRRG